MTDGPSGFIGIELGKPPGRPLRQRGGGRRAGEVLCGERPSRWDERSSASTEAGRAEELQRYASYGCLRNGRIVGVE